MAPDACFHVHIMQHLCDARGEAIEIDAASRRNINELMNEIARLQDAQVEVRHASVPIHLKEMCMRTTRVLNFPLNCVKCGG